MCGTVSGRLFHSVRGPIVVIYVEGVSIDKQQHRNQYKTITKHVKAVAPKCLPKWGGEINGIERRCITTTACDDHHHHQKQPHHCHILLLSSRLPRIRSFAKREKKGGPDLNYSKTGKTFSYAFPFLPPPITSNQFIQRICDRKKPSSA